MVAESIYHIGARRGNIVELIHDQLYFASYTDTQRSDASIRFISLDQRVHYEPFYTDFGPLNLSVLYRFCEYLHGNMQNKRKRKLVVYTNIDEKNRVNGAYIMGAYLIIYHGLTADAAYLKVEAAQPPKYIGFRDAAMGEPTYLLHLHDVLRGIEKALSLKWLDFSTFDAGEYEFYERVENGDMNWIIPGKILSFCGPHNESRVEDGYPYHSPETYFDYFRENDVSTIVRLNMRMYDASKFTEAGFEHVDLFFIDGSTPSDEIVEKFIDVVDNAKGGVAVHCKAGLGRTGTLIACWMMKEYGLTAAECMAWLRVCRPGSVIGPQQQWLISKQKFCWCMASRSVMHMPRKHRDGGGSDTSKSFNKLTSQVDDIRLSLAAPSSLPGQNRNSRENGNVRPRPSILPLRRPRRSCGDGNNNGNSKANAAIDETAIDAAGRSQGDRLLAMKARSQHAPAGTSTPTVTSHSGVSNGNGHVFIGHGTASHSAHSRTRTSNSLFHQPASPSPSPSRRRSPPPAHAVAARSSAANLLSSPRFSSPTTPIKPLASPSSPIGSRPRTASRNLSSLIPPPISKVIVSGGSVRTTTGKTLQSSPKSTPTLRKIISSSRPRPYPSQGARVELAANDFVYDLRSRTSPLSAAASSNNAMELPANADAIIGTRRKKRCPLIS